MVGGQLAEGHNLYNPLFQILVIEWKNVNLCLTCRVTHKTQRSDKGQVRYSLTLPMDLPPDLIIDETLLRNNHGNTFTLLSEVTRTIYEDKCCKKWSQLFRYVIIQIRRQVLFHYLKNPYLFRAISEQIFGLFRYMAPLPCFLPFIICYCVAINNLEADSKISQLFCYKNHSVLF